MVGAAWIVYPFGDVRVNVAGTLGSTGQSSDQHGKVPVNRQGPTAANISTIEAIRLAGQLEALPLDPVYSGKGLAGLIALIRQGRWRKDEDVIFLHTGGVPALFAYQSALGI